MTRSNKKKNKLKPHPNSTTNLFSGSSVPPEKILLSQEQKLMIARARASAKGHGINLVAGTPTSADGNCAFKAVISNINDRACFEEKLLFSTDYYRRIWVTDIKNRTLNENTWKILPDKEWEAGWQEMMISGVYERGIFGDLMLFGISCGTKKILLIFNTNSNTPHDPIYVCDPRKFGVEPDTDIPIVLAYNMVHYESLKPESIADIAKTRDLAAQYLGGNYTFGNKDLQLLFNTNVEEVDNIADNKLIKSDSIYHKLNTLIFQKKVAQLRTFNKYIVYLISSVR